MRSAHSSTSPNRRPAVGCVSYLNAKPLIDGFAQALPGHDLLLDVPARQIDLLATGRVDLALCPVIDYFASSEPLIAVPVGGIGCDGPTLTVRLFSPVPLDQITAVQLDAESHSSVCLLEIVLQHLTGRRPPVTVGLPAATAAAEQGVARLLIGDKVVTDAPSDAAYPHQLDLGAAWQEMTGQPFVFAVWLAHAEAQLGDLPRDLAALLERNLGRVDAIAHAHAPEHGWPVDRAADYLGRVLRYQVGARELDAITHFAQFAAQHGLIPNPPRALATAAPLPNGARA